MILDNLHAVAVALATYAQCDRSPGQGTATIRYDKDNTFLSECAASITPRRTRTANRS